MSSTHYHVFSLFSQLIMVVIVLSFHTHLVVLFSLSFFYSPSPLCLVLFLSFVLYEFCRLSVHLLCTGKHGFLDSETLRCFYDLSAACFRVV